MHLWLRAAGAERTSGLTRHTSTMRGNGHVRLVATTVVVVVALAAVTFAGLPSRPAPDAAPSAAVRSVASFAPPPTPAATEPPTPTADPTLESIPTAEPAPDDVLALAGQDGAPGLLDCGTDFRFTLESLDSPTGAEDLPGAEYDALREFVAVNVANGDTQLSLDFKAREVARYDGRVAFLIDRADPGPWGENGGPYSYVYFNRAGATWKWAGSGDCQPRAFGPAGYAGATWTLDPSFRRPRPSDTVLHLLVDGRECSSGRSASGRISPAYVIPDQFEVHIEILVQSLPGGQDCQGVPPTPATLRLPEALGDRQLRDRNAHLLSGTGG